MRQVRAVSHARRGRRFQSGSRARSPLSRVRGHSGQGEVSGGRPERAATREDDAANGQTRGEVQSGPLRRYAGSPEAVQGEGKGGDLVLTLQDIKARLGDGRDSFVRFIPSAHFDGRAEIKVKCPWHEDSTVSLTL